jgi:membrane protease YdiL (CAAX protease family)
MSAMTARRALPPDAADFGRALVPLALLAVAAAFHDVRIAVLIALGAGTAIGISRDAPVRWAWAGALPVGLSLAWESWPAPLPAADGSDCADPTSPVALWRAAQALVILAVVAGLAVRLQASRSSLGLRRPAASVVRLSLLGFVVVGPVALLVGPLLARPFFGDVSYDVGVVGALLPAVVFAVANGALEEVIYRGALLGWSARVMGAWPAIVGQAVVFGLAHSGPDVASSPILLSIGLGIGGLVAGIITVRTRSILLPLAIHVGFDIPLYYGLACST